MGSIGFFQPDVCGVRSFSVAQKVVGSFDQPESLVMASVVSDIHGAPDSGVCLDYSDCLDSNGASVGTQFFSHAISGACDSLPVASACYVDSTLHDDDQSVQFVDGFVESDGVGGLANSVVVDASVIDEPIVDARIVANHGMFSQLRDLFSVMMRFMYSFFTQSGGDLSGIEEVFDRYNELGENDQVLFQQSVLNLARDKMEAGELGFLDQQTIQDLLSCWQFFMADCMPYIKQDLLLTNQLNDDYYVGLMWEFLVNQRNVQMSYFYLKDGRYGLDSFDTQVDMPIPSAPSLDIELNTPLVNNAHVEDQCPLNWPKERVLDFERINASTIDTPCAINTVEFPIDSVQYDLWLNQKAKENDWVDIVHEPFNLIHDDLLYMVLI